jgi:hypothetical protein
MTLFCQETHHVRLLVWCHCRLSDIIKTGGLSDAPPGEALECDRGGKMKDRETYCRILGLPPDATLADVKGAYRRLARGSHPDLHPTDPQAEERFKEVTKAYEMLRSGGDRTGPWPGFPDPAFSAERADEDLLLGVFKLFRHYRPQPRPADAGAVQNCLLKKGKR